jgi:hypothetical protein
MNRPPISTLKWPLVLVVAATLLAAIGISWSLEATRTAAAARAQAEQARAAAEVRLSRSRQQQELIATHLADYEALAARGFVGAENRLAWIEAAQLAGRESGLPALEYRLDPRTDAPVALAQGLPLKQTRMTLDLPLLVETDLARFLAALERQAPGIHRVRGCSITRSGGAAFEAIDQPRLRAECEILWFTVATQRENAP